MKPSASAGSRSLGAGRWRCFRGRIAAWASSSLRSTTYGPRGGRPWATSVCSSASAPPPGVPALGLAAVSVAPAAGSCSAARLHGGSGSSRSTTTKSSSSAIEVSKEEWWCGWRDSSTAGASSLPSCQRSSCSASAGSDKSAEASSARSSCVSPDDASADGARDRLSATLACSSFRSPAESFAYLHMSSLPGLWLVLGPCRAPTEVFSGFSTRHGRYCRQGYRCGDRAHMMRASRARSWRGARPLTGASGAFDTIVASSLLSGALRCLRCRLPMSSLLRGHLSR
mmetsp:Transcript_45533/g.135799  ORF Transcript_45533/g.135799 Transcript_45533/m.135799 type:complete len:284 (+) Transcript_45533:955-1806(+)